MKLLTLILAGLLVAVASESRLPQRLAARLLPDAAIQLRRGEDPLALELSRLYPTAGADIVMLGDSLTAAPQWGELLPGHDVINRGVPGDTVLQALKRVDTVTRLRPRLVFVMLGTNDLGRGTPPAAILPSIRTLIQQLTAEGAGVVIQSVLHVADDGRWFEIRRIWDDRRNDRIRVLNQGLEALAADTGSGYLDLNATLAPDGVLPRELTTDGVHLRAAAYVKWAAAVEEYLRGRDMAGRKPGD